MAGFEVIEKIGSDLHCKCTDPGLFLPRAKLSFWRDGKLVGRNYELPTLSAKVDFIRICSYFFPPDSLAFTFSIFCLSNLVWHHPFLKQNSTHWFPGVSECELYFHFSNIDSTTATWLKEHHCCTSFLFLLQTCLSKLFRKLLKTVWAWKMLENQFYFLYIQKLLNLHTCALFVFVILMIS